MEERNEDLMGNGAFESLKDPGNYVNEDGTVRELNFDEED